MSLIKEKMTFGRHETFSLRYGWLTKGFVALRQDTAIFTKPEEAMIALGVGKNMVSAIQYWLQVVGVATFDNGKGNLTKLGHILFGEKGDPYLEEGCIKINRCPVSFKPHANDVNFQSLLI